MKHLTLLGCVLLCITAYSQDQSANYSIFNPKHFKKEFFIATNSGVLNTPIGLNWLYL